MTKISDARLPGLDAARETFDDLERPTRVLIVSDIQLYREGIAQALHRDKSLEVVGAASDADAAVDAVVETRPDVVLLDMAIEDGIAAVETVGAASTDVRIVALTVPELEDAIIELAEVGIAGYVTRDGTLDDLLNAVGAARSGELRCSPRIAGSLLRRVRTLATSGGGTDIAEVLTSRQLGVLELIEKGMSDKEIARALGIEVNTVKKHVHGVLQKLQVSRRGEAAALMRRWSPAPRSQRHAAR